MTSEVNGEDLNMYGNDRYKPDSSLRMRIVMLAGLKTTITIYFVFETEELRAVLNSRGLKVMFSKFTAFLQQAAEVTSQVVSL